eukprot:TRINITY_DN40242_c0_g1_i3.p1 TRINITY_DN40242_c0_g1~~TRINITY_DN40242_c0_g1_i3.p1  ORF type:complete len:105 (-),score=25.36 TRINITY_DN40242_c0_g1_i3:451-765(-)
MAAASAGACARRALARQSSSSSSLRSFSLSSGTATKMAGSSSPTPSSARFSRHRLPFISRLPVELGCAQSLMPLHSVTASALLTSKLFKSGSWGWLSEGFATPL